MAKHFRAPALRGYSKCFNAIRRISQFRLGAMSAATMELRNSNERAPCRWNAECFLNFHKVRRQIAPLRNLERSQIVGVKATLFCAKPHSRCSMLLSSETGRDLL
jgi:hypothetical protein